MKPVVGWPNWGAAIPTQCAAQATTYLVILADTSAWIDHLRRASPTLAWALEQQKLVMHPFVIGEIACGMIKRRQIVLELFAELPPAIVATHEEVMALTKTGS